MIKCYNMHMASLQTVLEHVGMSPEEWTGRMNASDVPLMMLRAGGEVYLEVEAVGKILCGTAAGQVWATFTARRKVRRKLTKAEKVKIAASQRWRCMRCEELLDETFEVDHVEMHALRGDDSRANTQALCPACHRKKTHDDLYISNPHFGVSAMQNLQNDELHRNAPKSIEPYSASSPLEVGVRRRPPEPVPFSEFRRPAKVFRGEPDDAWLGGGGGAGPPSTKPHS